MAVCHNFVPSVVPVETPLAAAPAGRLPWDRS